VGVEELVEQQEEVQEEKQEEKVDAAKVRKKRQLALLGVLVGVCLMTLLVVFVAWKVLAPGPPRRRAGVEAHRVKARRVRKRVQIPSVPQTVSQVPQNVVIVKRPATPVTVPAASAPGGPVPGGVVAGGEAVVRETVPSAGSVTVPVRTAPPVVQSKPPVAQGQSQPQAVPPQVPSVKPVTTVSSPVVNPVKPSVRKPELPEPEPLKPDVNVPIAVKAKLGPDGPVVGGEVVRPGVVLGTPLGAVKVKEVHNTYLLCTDGKGRDVKVELVYL